jgi:protein-S-isoprenylcysteine O-methyltransferase Ste14
MSRRSWLGTLRVLAVYAFVGLLLWLSTPTVPLVAIGGILVAAGETVRFWAAGHLLKTRELAVSGPYRYTQNPLYLGRLLILAGFCVMAPLPIPVGGRAWPGNILALGLGCAVFFAYYLPRKVRVEGARLGEVHGAAWSEYASEVPVLFPRATPRGRNVRVWDAGRMLRNREHWMLAGVCLLWLLFLLKALSDRS